MTGPVNFEIRKLATADWAVLREARLAGVAEAPDAFASTLEGELGLDERQWRERLSSAVFFGAWQAGQGDRLVGLVGGFAETGDEGDATDPGRGRGESRAWHLISMWVSPRARGQGLADQLVDAVCGLARGEGAEQIALWVTQTNPRARAFYRRAGFRGTGERQLVRPTEPGLWEERMVADLR